MAWYVVHVGRVPGIYRTWEDCYAQVNRYPGCLHKKYDTEAEALRAYCSHPAYYNGQPACYGSMNVNHNQPAYHGPINVTHDHRPTLEIEAVVPAAGDAQITRFTWKDVVIFLWLCSLLFLFGSSRLKFCTKMKLLYV